MSYKPQQWEWEMLLEIIDENIGQFWIDRDLDHRYRVMQIRTKIVKQIEELNDAHI